MQQGGFVGEVDGDAGGGARVHMGREGRQLFPAESRRDKVAIASAYQAWNAPELDEARTHILRNGIGDPPWSRTNDAGQPDAHAGVLQQKDGEALVAGGGLRFRGGVAGGGLTSGPSVPTKGV